MQEFIISEFLWEKKYNKYLELIYIIILVIQNHFNYISDSYLYNHMVFYYETITLF